MASSPSLTHALPVRPGRAARIALWSIQIALAGMFLLAGGSKLVGAPPMVALFNAIGIGQWFRYVTGLIEVGSALALLVPFVTGVWRAGTRANHDRRHCGGAVHRRRFARSARDLAGCGGSGRLGSSA